MMNKCDGCGNQGEFTYEDFINHIGDCYYCTENYYNFKPKNNTLGEKVME